MKELQEKELLNALSTDKIVKVEDLASMLSVSPSTVRRKLTELQSRGLLTRVRGGA